MTTGGDTAGRGKIRVLVQTDVPQNAGTQEIFRIAEEAWRASTGFEVDKGYRPVGIRLKPSAPKGYPPVQTSRPDVDKRRRPAGTKLPDVGEGRRPGRAQDPNAERGDNQGGTEAPRERSVQPPAAGLRTVILRGRIPEAQISALRARANVRKVSRDIRLDPFAVRRKVGSDCEKTGQPVGDVKLLAKRLGVDKIWAQGYDGHGVVVGVVDGGITAYGRDVNATELPAIPYSPATGRVADGWPDDWGTTAVGWGQHGNMMAFDIQTVAPAATLWDIRIWEPAGVFDVYLSNAIAGYREAIDRHRLSGEPHILSNSWGLYRRDLDDDGEYASNPQSLFAVMVEEALDEGILVLFAAGNCGEPCPFSLCRRDPLDTANIGPGKSILGPNGHPRVMTIGAANLEDDWCAYTSQGFAVLPPNAAKPDFCAYTRFEGYFPGADPILRDFDGGTSAATAVAAGVIALLKHKRPDLTQEEARAVLAETAQDILMPGFDQNSGAGIIRANAAFDLL